MSEKKVAAETKLTREIKMGDLDPQFKHEVSKFRASRIWRRAFSVAPELRAA